MIKIIECPILGIIEYIFEELPVEEKPPIIKKYNYSFDWNYMFRGMELEIGRIGNRFRHFR